MAWKSKIERDVALATLKYAVAVVLFIVVLVAADIVERM